MIKYDDPVEQAKLDLFKERYNRFKFVKHIAFALYMFLPFMEKPAWCIDNPAVDVKGDGYWHC